MKRTMIKLLATLTILTPAFNSAAGTCPGPNCTISIYQESVGHSKRDLDIETVFIGQRPKTCNMGITNHNFQGDNNPDTSARRLKVSSCSQANKFTKIVLDGKLYKTPVQTEIVVFLNKPQVTLMPLNDMENCSYSAGTSDIDLVIYAGAMFQTIPIIHFEYGVDEYDRPIMIFDSVSGNVVCDGWKKEVYTANQDDLIFKAGFE